MCPPSDHLGQAPVFKRVETRIVALKALLNHEPRFTFVDKWTEIERRLFGMIVPMNDGTANDRPNECAGDHVTGEVCVLFDPRIMREPSASTSAREGRMHRDATCLSFNSNGAP